MNAHSRELDIPTLARELRALGVEPGGVLVVHTAFSKIAPVENGPQGLIEALRTALGPDGTLVMPSMSDDGETPFDPGQTPCRDLGIVPDTFWRLPGVERSNNPHAFAAIGPHAATITAPHPLDVPHGPDSPVGRAHDLDAQVLLIGVGHDANTTIHLAENTARVRYGIPKYVTVARATGTERVHYFEVDHCCQRFALMDEWLQAAGKQRHATIGNAQVRLARSRDILAVALAHLKEHETVFLHDPGACAECDESRRGLERAALA